MLENFNPATSHILAVETGGHTSLIVNKCEENFGYIGHAINGSASVVANTNYQTYTFSTGTAVNICGAEGAPSIGIVGTPVLGPNGRLCALNQTVTLSPNPSGGTLSIVSGPGTITGNVLSFTGTSGNVIVGYTVTSDCGPQTSSRTFTIEACDALPVTFISFDAVKKENVVDLFWATAKEQNNKGYEILHSVDGKDWNKLGFVASKANEGNSNTRLDYTYTDEHPVYGKNYYRLMQTDIYGKTSYSPVRFVQFGEAIETVKIYPNPTNDKIYIDGATLNSNVRIYDAVGLLVWEQRIENYVEEVSVKQLNSGFYYIHIIDMSGKVIIEKLIKD